MRRSILCSVTLMALLSACSRHESTLTGSYGQERVSGQVVMAGALAGSSPAGVRVSVPGTGMTSILGGDGRFSFVGVPEGSEISFWRSDGIDTRLAVSQSGTLLIELSGGKGSNPSRRRGVSPKDPGPSLQVEGILRTVSADSLTVLDSHRSETTVKLTATTLIRKGEQTVAAAALHVGDRVHIKASMDGSVLTALQVIVQNPEDEKEHEQEAVQIEGLIVSVAPTSLTVHDSHEREVMVALTSSTEIRKGSQTLTPSDLRAGDRVHVVARQNGDTLSAVSVVVQQQRN